MKRILEERFFWLTVLPKLSEALASFTPEEVGLVVITFLVSTPTFLELLEEIAFLGASFLAAGFFATDFLVASFFAEDFLAAGFFATDFLAADFLAADFLAAGFFFVATLTPSKLEVSLTSPAESLLSPG